MKFLGIVALVGFASASNLESDIKAAQQLLQQNGITQQKMDNAVKKAENKFQQTLSQAQSMAADNGVLIDFNKIFDNLQTSYGDQVEAAVSNAVGQGQAAYNGNRNKIVNIKNNSDFKKVQKAVKNANFQKILNQAAKAVNSQINNIDNAQIKNNLKNLVANGKQQAATALRDQGLTGNIMKKAQQEFNKNNGQAKLDALLAQAKAAAAQLE